ncbi:MAG: MTAP family purine nucleoside phosphorylase [Gemmatimonadota bacterium]
MARLGIIGGSAFLEGGPPPGAEPRDVETDRGRVRAHAGGSFVFLSRHGEGDTYRPPHRVRHHAHALALDRLGVERAVGLCSVGALHREIELGAAVVPEDYLSLQAPPTFAGDERLHVVPELDGELRRLLLDVAREVGDPVREGVYAQTAGPRFETRAEVRLLADYADVVGMTAASEATLCQERGIDYAALAIVDNHAHGVTGEELSLEAFEEKQAENRGRARAALRILIDRSRTLETDAGEETT